jgi:transposase
LEFQRKIKQYEIEKRPIVYIDESGFTVDAPRNRGYSKKGSRCYGTKDWHSKGRMNAIGALIGFKLLTVCLFDSNINADVFYSWVKEDLIGVLSENSVIVMDNAAFHKREDIINQFKDNNHTVEFLPAYSPDLNPIENKWAQAKAIRKKEKCTPSELFFNSKL